MLKVSAHPMGTAPCHVSSPAALICLWPWLQPGECTHTLPAELGLGTMSQLPNEANNLHSLFMVEKKVVLRLLPRRCQGQRGAEGKARGCTEKSHRHCLSCSAAVLTLHNRLSSQSLAAAKSNEPRCTAGTVCAFWSRDQQEETNLCLTLCPAFLPATHMHLLAPGHLLSQHAVAAAPLARGWVPTPCQEEGSSGGVPVPCTEWRLPVECCDRVTLCYQHRELRGDSACAAARQLTPLSWGSVTSSTSLSPGHLCLALPAEGRQCTPQAPEMLLSLAELLVCTQSGFLRCQQAGAVLGSEHMN